MAGQQIPQGTSVGCNPYVIHMDKEVFGEDVESYNPERWLRPGAESMDSYMLQVSCLPVDELHFQQLKILSFTVRSGSKDLSREECEYLC